MALYRRSTVATEGYSAGILEGDSTVAPVDADESSMTSTDDTEGGEEDTGDSWEDSSMPRTVELTASAVRRGAYSHVRTEESTAAAAPVGLSATSSDALHACLHPSDHQRTSVSQHYTVFLPGGDGSLYLIVAVVAAIVVAKLASSTSI